MRFPCLIFFAALFNQYASAASLKHLVCLDQISKTVAASGTVERWDSFPGGMAGKVNGFGVVEVYPSDKSTRLVVRTSKNEITYAFKTPQCERVTISQRPIGNEFHNSDLADLLQKNKSGGFIYIWSPNMILSVEEVSQLSKLHVAFPFTVVLDPNATQKTAALLVKEKKLASSYLRPMQSSALVDAGILTHFPSIVFYKNGSIKKLVPGQSGSALKDIIEKELK